jgi:hypothetical protein
VIPTPAEGEGYSTGRGGVANIHPQGAPAANENPVSDNEVAESNHIATMGLAYYLKKSCVADLV